MPTLNATGWTRARPTAWPAVVMLPGGSAEQPGTRAVPSTLVPGPALSSTHGTHERCVCAETGWPHQRPHVRVCTQQHSPPRPPHPQRATPSQPSARRNESSMSTSRPGLVRDALVAQPSALRSRSHVLKCATKVLMLSMMPRSSGVHSRIVTASIMSSREVREAGLAISSAVHSTAAHAVNQAIKQKTFLSLAASQVASRRYGRVRVVVHWVAFAS